MKDTICALVVLAVAACQAAPPAGRVDDTRIYTREEFLDRVVGKPLTYIDDAGNADPRIRVTISADGTLSGRGLLDDELGGTWWWQDAYWCRKLAGHVRAPAEDCQVVRLGDGILTIIRDRGRGPEVRLATGDAEGAGKRALAEEIHAYVMERAQEYRLTNQTKAMVICVRWNSPTPPGTDIKKAFSTRTYSGSNGPIFTPLLRRNALRRCEEWKARDNADCACQPLDEDGQNVLRIP